MSLINDALKKAQSERPSPTTHHQAMADAAGQPKQRPPRKRRYLFGFIMAVLIVGLFSTGISTYLVYQILGEKSADSGTPTNEEATSQDEVVSTPALVEEKPVQEAVAENLPEESTPPAPASTPEPESPMAIEAVEPEPLVATETAVAAPEPEPEPVAIEPVAATVSAASPDAYPEVWTRLEDFEVRGIMSGGSRTPKVLIFDTKLQKSKSYRPGDLIDGALSLKVASITPGIIYFENHDGAQFSKSF